MKAKLYIAFTAIIAILIPLAVQAKPESGLLKELGISEYPGSKRLTEISLPSCKLLDDITKEFGSQLGLSDVKQASIVTFRVDPSVDAQRIYSFFEPGISAQGWKAMIRSFEGQDGMVVLYNESIGMLVINIDPPGGRDRQLTLVRVMGTIDLSKTAGSSANLSSRIRQWMGGGYGPDGKSIGANFAASKLQSGQPISIPPSQWMHMRSTGSAITGRFAEQNTAVLRVIPGSGDAGEMVRTDEGLIVFVSPGADVPEAVLPSNTPKILQLTEGSLSITGGKPGSLTVTSTGAPITLDSVAMISGDLKVKGVGAAVSISLSDLKGGSLDVSVTSSDLTVIVPKSASAKFAIDAPSTSIRNETGVESQTVGDHTTLVLGNGGATCHLQVVKGTVTVKSAN